MLRRRRSESRAKDAAEALVAATGPPRDRAHLPEWLALAAPDGPETTGALQVVGGLLQSIPGGDLARLDRAARSLMATEGQGWSTMTPADVPALAEAAGAPVAVGALASLHPDGHVRFAAVRFLSHQWTERELRWLLLRSADWVAEVRVVATEAVRARAFGPSRADYLGPLADDVAFLAGDRLARDLSGIKLRDELRATLRHNGVEHLRAAAQSPDQRTRRAAVELLVGVDPPVDLLAGQLAGGDVVAVTTAAEAALATDQATAAATLLLDNRWTPLRESALRAVFDHAGPNKELVERGLRDPAPRVRAVARRGAEGAEMDALQWYRAQVATDPLVAMRGFGDIGENEDAQLAELFVETRRTPLRAAAIRVVARQGGSGFVDVLQAAALHDNRRVARAAIRGLVRRGISDEQASGLWTEARGHSATAATRILGQVLPRASRWVRLQCGLEALVAPQPAVAAAGVRLLRTTWSAWNRAQTEASPAELEALQDLLVVAAPALEEADAGLLAAYRTVVFGPARGSDVQFEADAAAAPTGEPQVVPEPFEVSDEPEAPVEKLEVATEALAQVLVDDVVPDGSEVAAEGGGALGAGEAPEVAAKSSDVPVADVPVEVLESAAQGGELLVVEVVPGFGPEASDAGRQVPVEEVEARVAEVPADALVEGGETPVAAVDTRVAEVLAEAPVDAGEAPVAEVVTEGREVLAGEMSEAGVQEAGAQGGEVQGGEVPGGEVPGGEVPGGEVPGGEVPGVGTDAPLEAAAGDSGVPVADVAAQVPDVAAEGPEATVAVPAIDVEAEHLDAAPEVPVEVLVAEAEGGEVLAVESRAEEVAADDRGEARVADGAPEGDGSEARVAVPPTDDEAQAADGSDTTVEAPGTVPEEEPEVPEVGAETGEGAPVEPEPELKSRSDGRGSGGSSRRRSRRGKRK